MPVFEEDPAQFSKSRLKSDLVAHNVTLPSENSKKDVYVDLHLKNIDLKNVADFSSDEEDQAVEETPGAEPPPRGDMRDVRGLTDDELKAALLRHGVSAGPIVASTRALYERRLQKLLHNSGPPETPPNGTGDAYSDSEEEGDEGDDEGDKEGKEEESDSEDSRQEAVSHLDQAPEGDEQRASAPGRWERNVGNAVKSPSAASRPRGLFSVDRPTGLGPAVTQSRSPSLPRTHRQMERDKRPRTDGERWSEGQGDRSQDATPDIPTDGSILTPNTSSYKQTFEERLADGPTGCSPTTVPIPTGIAATRRRPIKGAAGRPIRYKYPDAPPASPLTLERREVERCLVPVYIQVLVFLAMACVLYLLYACMEENPYNPLLPLLDGLSEIMERQEGPAAQADPVDLAVPDSLSA